MSNPKLFDVHTHVQFVAFKDDAEAVIQRAVAASVWMINVGTQRDTSIAATALAQKFSEGVYATVGLHPVHTEKSFHDTRELGKGGAEFTSRGEEFNYEEYKKLAVHEKVVAVGECGLDYYRLSEDTKEKQKAAFLRQIELAYDVKKPLMIHCRKAFDDLISVLQATTHQLLPRPGVIHFFTGTVDEARHLLNLGFSFSFGGVITFARDYDDAVRYIPIDRILLETDAPYVAPIPYRGKRNEPRYVEEMAKKIAELKEMNFGEVADATTVNTKKIFGIK